MVFHAFITKNRPKNRQIVHKFIYSALASFGLPLRIVVGALASARIIKICLLDMCGRNNVGSKFGGLSEIPPLFRPTIISTAIISVQHKIDH